MYSTSLVTHADHEAWLINSGASFHMTPHRVWFCEYKSYDGCDAFQGDDRKTRITGLRNFKLRLIKRRIRMLPCIFHIQRLAKNLIFLSKMDEASVKIVFGKDTYNMVREALVLMMRGYIRTLRTSCWEILLLIGAIVLLFLKVKKKICSL